MDNSKPTIVRIDVGTCPVCGLTMARGGLPLPNTSATTDVYNDGSVLCPEHERQVDAGYVIAVEIDKEASEFEPGGDIVHHKVVRLERRFALDKVSFQTLFRDQPPASGVVYISTGMADALARAAVKVDAPHTEESRIITAH